MAIWFSKYLLSVKCQQTHKKAPMQHPFMGPKWKDWGQKTPKMLPSNQIFKNSNLNMITWVRRYLLEVAYIGWTCNVYYSFGSCGAKL